MMHKFYGSAVVIAALAFTGTAFASQIDVNTSVSEPSLYEIANNAGLFSDLNANSPQVDNAHWTGGANGSSSSVLQAAWAQQSSDAIFGAYSIKDPSIKLNLLSGLAQPGSNGDTHTKGYLNYIGKGVFTAYTQDVSTGDHTPVQTANFGSDVFGYFLTIGSNTYYSDSKLNGGISRMVGYQGLGGGNNNNLLKNEYLFGWQDGTGQNNDHLYQDYVATVESVRPVPEPSSIAMFGVGLLMIGFAARRIQKRNV